MHFQIEPTSGVPVFQQLIRQIKMQVALGALKPGDKLPSVRELAVDLMVNPNTIQKVYRDLSGEGVIYARKGLGVFVAEVQSTLHKVERLRRVNEAADLLITEAIHLGFQLQEIEGIIEERLERFHTERKGGGNDE